MVLPALSGGKQEKVVKTNCKRDIGVGRTKATQGTKATRNRRDVDTGSSNCGSTAYTANFFTIEPVRCPVITSLVATATYNERPPRVLS